MLRRSNLPLYVGTSGWSYTIWKPAFYPADVASKNFLKFYATQLTAVEVNYTFRSRLSEKAATGWMADVGPNFRFALKANQYITHIRRLQNVEEPLQRFLPTLQPLATQLGPVLFQLPPNLKADVPLLRDFLALLPRSFKAALEFRHASWFNDEVYKTLQERNAALCVAETEKLSTPEVRTASFIYFRFRQPSYYAGRVKAAGGSRRTLCRRRAGNLRLLQARRRSPEPAERRGVVEYGAEEAGKGDVTPPSSGIGAIANLGSPPVGPTIRGSTSLTL